MGTGTSSAQITPGKLHESHEHLEGIKNCTKCHSLGDQVPPEKCLECHTLLRERIDARQGLHARAQYANCTECHIDHNGRAFALVYWKEGIDAFLHEVTGYGLEGRHQELKCRECHRKEFVTDAARLRSHGMDPSRTFLGLSIACRSCHEDVHRDQLGTSCESCHTAAAWRPAAKFAHDRTRYALTGRHQSVACAKCHPAESGGARPLVRYSGLSYGDCASCHRDVHNGRLVGSCASCHTTTGWHEVKTAGFNHDATRYPLRGRHTALECTACHRQGAADRALRYGACTDCHPDSHRGRFMTTPGGGACERCHTVAGFSPSTYTVADHQTSPYRLAGAHLAVSCAACHLDPPGPGAPVASPRHATPASTSHASSASVFSFAFASTECRTCHADPHGGETSRWMEGTGCEACHRVESWRAITFDHGTTRYPLEGRHAAVVCSGCHRAAGPGAPPGRLAFRGLAGACTACHADVHAGQFAAGGAGSTAIACEKCHDPRSWRPEKFDHRRDTRFPIDGAHARTPCSGCHPTEIKGDRAVARYRPTPSACEACHAKSGQPLRDEKETR